MRRHLWIWLGLLCLAGAWFLWPRSAKLPAKPSVTAKVVAKPIATTVRPASTAPNILATVATNAVKAGVANTNPFGWRLSNTSKTIGQLAGDRHAILLENALIDTGIPLKLSIPKKLQSPGDPGAYIVQAYGPIGNAFRAMLASAGAQIVSYIPNDAYLVRLNQGGADGLAANPLTQAVIPYEPYYKIQSSVLGAVVNDQPFPADARFNVAAYPDSADAGRKWLAQAGITVLIEQRSPFGQVFTVQGVTDVAALARSDLWQLVEPYYPRQRANDLSRQTLGVAADTQVSSNYMNLTGSNVVVEVNDSGIDATHPDFQTGSGAPVRVFGGPLIDTEGHGTHVAGIIAGNGLMSITVTNAQGSIMPATDGQFRGMAPLANLLSMSYYDSDQDLQEAAARNNAPISNNSWNNNDPAYDLEAASYDAAVRDALSGVTGSQPVLFVFSAGNVGAGDDSGSGGNPDTILSPGTAKNVITVGALEQLRNITNVVTDLNSNQSAVWQPETDTGYQVWRLSSRGNVGIGLEGQFGRYKPDLVAPGTFVISTRSAQWDTEAYYNPTNNRYTVFADFVPPDAFSVAPMGFFVWNNTARITFSMQTNTASPSPFPTNMPIYVWPGTDPQTTAGVFVGTDSAAVPSALQLLSPVGVGWACEVSNITSLSLAYDMVVDVQTTNDLGNYFEVLSNMNQSLGTNNPANISPGPYYRYETGTSMSAAGVSGVLALMEDYFTNTLSRTPSPALLKAMLINGARPTQGYDYQVQNSINFQVWGLPSLPNSLPPGQTTNVNVACASFFVDQDPSLALATGDRRTYLVTVDTNTDAVFLPLQVTLVWTDPPGNPAAAIKLVNSLYLIVTNFDDPANPVIYYGNDIPGGQTANTPENSTNAPVLDVINNVENVIVAPAPLLGSQFSVTVVGGG